MHYRKLFDSNYIAHWDLEEKEEVTLTIERVEPVEVYNPQTHEKEKKNALVFKEARKPMILNVTNADRIAETYNEPDVDKWVGKKVTLRVEQVRGVGGKTVPGIRVKRPAEKPLKEAVK